MVKCCTMNICGNPATEQVEKLFWERTIGILATAPTSLWEGLMFSIVMKNDRDESVKAMDLQ